jgi:hypothetical protein
MLNVVQDFVQSILPAKRKTTASGWTSFNAVCCHQRGETLDTRGRGGITGDANGTVSYHCFNCGFKAHYQPGRPLSYKFRRLLQWLGAADNDIQRLVIEAIRIKQLVSPDQLLDLEEKIDFTPHALPAGTVSFSELQTFMTESTDTVEIPSHIHNKIHYVKSRHIDTQKYEFYVTDTVTHSLHQRVIIPCVWQGRTVGYTARAVLDGIKPKYFSDTPPGYVFNMDQQGKEWKFVIVCEGPFDAMSVDGVAVLGSECSEQQADIIDSLAREVIVVADKDKAGDKLIRNAMTYGWSVSFPVWQETCKDINEAVVRYGKLFVIKSILMAKHSTALKIELMRKNRHN